MKRVKLFTSSIPHELESKINGWLSLEEIQPEIVDIKHSCSMSTHGATYTALVIYLKKIS